MKKTIIAVSLMCPMIIVQASDGPNHDHNNQPVKEITFPQRWKAPAEAAAVGNPIRASKKSVIHGEKLFTANCIRCHGKLDEEHSVTAKRVVQPDPDNPDDRDSDGALAWKIKNGRGHMPTWKGNLAEEDVWHLVNYLRHMTKD